MAFVARQGQVRSVLQLEHNDSATRADGARALFLADSAVHPLCSDALCLTFIHCPSCRRETSDATTPNRCFLSRVTTSAQSHAMGRDVHRRCPLKSCHRKLSPWNLGNVLPFKMRPVKVVIPYIYREDLELVPFPQCPRQASIPPHHCLPPYTVDLRSSLLTACPLGPSSFW